MPFPIMRVRGGPRQRGQQYGEQAAELIELSVAAYRHILGHYSGWDWQRIRELASEYLPPIRSHTPHLLDEIEAIARGAALDTEDVLALNLRTELLNRAILRRSARECTAFVLRPSASLAAHTLIGQNWDWKPGVAGSLMLLVAEPDDRPRFVTLVEAGLLAKLGMNAAGVGLATNALISDRDSGSLRVPYHLILRSILEAPGYAEAVRMLDRLPAASAANYLIADREGSFENFEALPDARQGEPRDPGRPTPQPEGTLFRTGDHTDRYAHTNHYLCATAGFRDLGLELGPDSPIRLERMQGLLSSGSGPLGIEQLQDALTDHVNHPYSVCAHSDPNLPAAERYVTLASVIMDLTDRTLWIARGNPCQAEYRRYQFDDLFAPPP